MFIKMFYYEKKGEWHVVRIDHNNKHTETPWTYKSKDSAINYIVAHGLTAELLLDKNCK